MLVRKRRGNHTRSGWPGSMLSLDGSFAAGAIVHMSRLPHGSIVLCSENTWQL